VVLNEVNVQVVNKRVDDFGKALAANEKNLTLALTGEELNALLISDEENHK